MQRDHNAKSRRRQNWEDQHERYETSQQLAAYLDSYSFTNVQEVAKMVEGMRAVETDSKEVLKQLNHLLRMPDVDMEKIQPLWTNWISLQRVRVSDVNSNPVT